MWAASVDQERLQRVTSQNQWHRDDEGAGGIHAPHPTEEVEDIEDKHRSGTWGERDVGGFDEEEAAAQFEALRRNLTQLSQVRSRDSNSLRRTISRGSG